MDEPALRQLMGAYYHQDFSEIHGGMWEALDDFRRDEPDLARLLAGECSQVLRALNTEEAVERHLVEELGAAVYVSADEGGYIGWLSEIGRRAAASPPALDQEAVGESDDSGESPIVM